MYKQFSTYGFDNYEKKYIFMKTPLQYSGVNKFKNNHKVIDCIAVRVTRFKEQLDAKLHFHLLNS